MRSGVVSDGDTATLTRRCSWPRWPPPHRLPGQRARSRSLGFCPSPDPVRLPVANGQSVTVGSERADSNVQPSQPGQTPRTWFSGRYRPCSMTGHFASGQQGHSSMSRKISESAHPMNSFDMADYPTVPTILSGRVSIQFPPHEERTGFARLEASDGQWKHATRERRIQHGTGVHEQLAISTRGGRRERAQ